MNIIVDFTTSNTGYAVSRSWILKRITKMINGFPRQENIPTIKKFEKGVAYTISVALVGDKAIREINRDYRKKDKVTDVISIESDPDEFFSGAKEKDLGEIIISIPQTKRQSKEFGVSFRFELEKLLIHGFLHALGYDHIVDEDYKIMSRLEKYMKKLLINIK